MKKILLLIMFLIPFKVDAMSASSMVAVDLDNDYILAGAGIISRINKKAALKLMRRSLCIQE